MLPAGIRALITCREHPVLHPQSQLAMFRAYRTADLENGFIFR